MFYLFRLFYSFLPLHNPIGFGAADFIELTLAIAFFAGAWAWQKWDGLANRLAVRTAWCMTILAVLPVALRLGMLRWSPIPTPLGADDYSYLLLGDTLAHFRLTNPMHPMHRFFETLFVLQQPTYSSIYPLGPGLMLALGELIFREPWAGIAIATGAFTALSYWMLRAWVAPAWALLGGVLAAIEFGPLNHWMNTYWGGSLAAASGCLVFGALPRLKNQWRARDAILLGVGLAIHVLTRPFETIFLAAAVVIFLLAWRVPLPELMRSAAISAAIAVPTLGLIALHDHRVTGNWATLPYAQCRYQYGVPCTFTFQANTTPHYKLTREQERAWQIQTVQHGDGTETIGTFLARLGERVRFYRFFFLPPLYLALPAFFWSFRDRRMWFVAGTIGLFYIGTTIYPYFYAHYVAAITCLFLLVTVVSLENLSKWKIGGHPAGADAVRVILLLCGAHFLLWYSVQLTNQQALERYETWDEVNHGDSDGRIAVNKQLAGAAGKQLVFVRYWPKHEVAEWVYNGADIDRQKTVFARDLGAEENQTLLNYFPDRKVWLLEPDASPPKLSPYQVEQPQAPKPPEEPKQPSTTKKKKTLHFEEVK